MASRCGLSLTSPHVKEIVEGGLPLAETGTLSHPQQMDSQPGGSHGATQPEDSDTQDIDSEIRTRRDSKEIVLPKKNVGCGCLFRVRTRSGKFWKALKI